MKKEFSEPDLPPFLQDLKGKGDGFKIPEGYFDHMEEAVFARLKAAGDLERPGLKVVKKPGMFPLFIRPRVAMGLAAALALILSAVWFIRQPSVPVQSVQYASTELTEEDIESYLLENAKEFEPEQLAALTPAEIVEPPEENASNPAQKSRHAAEELHPDDLNNIIDEMTDEELEEIL